jgi:hypothetical protein
MIKIYILFSPEGTVAFGTHLPSRIQSKFLVLVRSSIVAVSFDKSWPLHVRKESDSEIFEGETSMNLC